jgi:hypothetical protein
MRDLPVLKIDLKEPEKFGNLAAKLDVSERRLLAQELILLIKIDETSMSDWLGKARGYLDKITEDDGDDKPEDREQEGAGEKPPPSTEMTLSAVIQFSARATDALLGEPDLARASEPGAEPLAAWVSTQVRSKDPNWILDTDPMVVHMSATGLAWRKRDFDDEDRTFTSYFRTCEEVIINKNVRNHERAPRITDHFTRYPYEIERSISRGKWVDYEPVYDEADPQAPKNFYDCDAWLDLDGDGMDEPWSVVISLDDHAEVVKIKPRWSKNTVVDTKDELFFDPIHRFYPYRMLPDPAGGFFPMGFGKLLDRTEAAADNLLASIVDTAQSNAQDGGILAGSSISVPNSVELKGNRINVIPTDGRKLTDIFAQFPVKQLSPASVQILEKIMTLGDRLAGTLNLLENAPASMTATMAKGVIDSGTQVQSAVHRRLVASMTQEFRAFIRMADAYGMLPDGMHASAGDGVACTADPSLATEMARSALASLYMELLKAPMFFNPQKVGMRLLQTLRIPKPEELIAEPQSPQATPYEKIQGAVHLMKQQTEKIKVIGAVAVQFTQALKNLVEASGGMQDQRAALLNMAQLEQTIQNLVGEASSAGDQLNGMATQPGNGGAGASPQPSQSFGNPIISGGAGGGPDNAGAGGGTA